MVKVVKGGEKGVEKRKRGVKEKPSADAEMSQNVPECPTTPPEGTITPKQEQAIAALLLHPSISAAAESIEVDRKTLSRWLQDETFKEKYRQAQKEALGEAMSGIQTAMSKAVETLKRNCTCGNAFAENMAAQAIISQSLKAAEMRDFEARLEEVERLLSQDKGGTV